MFRTSLLAALAAGVSRKAAQAELAFLRSLLPTEESSS